MKSNVLALPENRLRNRWGGWDGALLKAHRLPSGNIGQYRAMSDAIHDKSGVLGNLESAVYGWREAVDSSNPTLSVVEQFEGVGSQKCMVS